MGAVLALVFRSWRVGLISLVPNVLPIVLYFGLLGVLPITLNLTTSLVACAVFGIAIDDTVVFLARYAIERARHASQAIEATLAGVVRPATITSAALCAGFLALTAGELRAQAEFGLLAAVTLACAWLLDLTLTPVLCRDLDVKSAWMGRGSG
jgi:predicted RND superfamily exporter protein